MVILICVLSKFINIIYGVNDKEGLFAYPYMSSFLYAVGNELFPFTSGLIALYFSNRVFQNFDKVFKAIAYTWIAIGAFGLINIVIPKRQLVEFTLKYLPSYLAGDITVRDFPPIVYLIIMIILSFTASIISGKIQTALIYSERQLRKIISVLMDSLYTGLEEKNLINPWKIKEFKKHRLDVTDKVVDYEQGRS